MSHIAEGDQDEYGSSIGNIPILLYPEEQCRIHCNHGPFQLCTCGGVKYAIPFSALHPENHQDSCVSRPDMSLVTRVRVA